MAQYMRPISDVYIDWYCSTGSLRYALIDEVIADDTDYIYNQADGYYVECKLSIPEATPLAGIGTFYIRAKKLNSGDKSVIPSIRMGSTIIKTSGNIYPTLTYAQYSFSLTAAEMATITNWSDLRIRFLGVSSSNTLYISQAYFEVPDGGSKPGLEMGCLF